MIISCDEYNRTELLDCTPFAPHAVSGVDMDVSVCRLRVKVFSHGECSRRLEHGE